MQNFNSHYPGSGPKVIAVICGFRLYFTTYFFLLLFFFFFKAKVLYPKTETFLEIYFRNSNVNDLIQTEDSKKINI